MKTVILTATLLALNTAVAQYFDVYSCQSIDPHVSQAEIEATQGDYHKQCILFEGQTYDFGQSFNKVVKASEEIHIKPGFESGPFDANGEMHLKIDKSEIGVYAYLDNGQTDLNSIPVRSKLEVGLDLPQTIDDQIADFITNGQTATNINPFDPDQIDIQAEFFVLYNGVWQGPFKNYGFYYEDFERNTADESTWIDLGNNGHDFRIRFSPRIIGLWKCRISIYIAGSLYEVLNDFQFNVTNSNRAQFMRVGDNKRFFRAGNDPYFPVGVNLPFQGLDFPDAYFYPTPIQSGKYPDFLANMTELKNAGGNYFRFLLAPWTCDIEFEKLGDYSDRLPQAWEIDQMLKKAEELDLKIHFNLSYYTALNNPGEGKWYWDWAKHGDSVYAACASWFLPDDPGYCYHTDSIYGVATPEDFLVDPNSKKFYKRRLRYIVSRYGYSSSIGAYELLNEINTISQYDPLIASANPDGSGCDANNSPDLPPYQSVPDFPEKVYLWQDEMAGFIKNDMQHSLHPICVNYTGAPRNGEFQRIDDRKGIDVPGGDLSYSSPNVDIMSYNDYGLSINKYEVQSDINFELSGYQKPLMYSEIGTGGCDGTLSDRQFIAMSAFTGAGGAALPWSPNPTDLAAFNTPERDTIWSMLAIMKDFMAGIPLDEENWTPDKSVLSDLSAEMLYLKSPTNPKRAVGVINNRTVNHYTQKLVDCVDDTFCECFFTEEEESNTASVYLNTASFDYNWSGHTGITQRLKMKNMGGLKHYNINFYNAFTGQQVHADDKWTSPTGRLKIRYPELSDTPALNNGSVLLVKVFRSSQGSFLSTNNDWNGRNTLEEKILEAISTSEERTGISKTPENPSVNYDLQEDSRIKVFPNPSYGKFNLMIPQELLTDLQQIEVRSSLGSTVFETNKLSSLMQIDLKNCPQGIYYIYFKGIQSITKISVL